MTPHRDEGAIDSFILFLRFSFTTFAPQSQCKPFLIAVPVRRHVEYAKRMQCFLFIGLFIFLGGPWAVCGGPGAHQPGDARHAVTLLR